MAVTIASTSTTLTVEAPARSQLAIGPNNTVALTAQTNTLTTSVIQSVATVSVFQQGIAGPPGTASTSEFEQLSPLATWVIAHDLNRYPNIVVLDTAGDLMLVNYQYLDRNTIQVTFGAPTSGVAYIN